jgi:hypothetical protein
MTVEGSVCRSQHVERFERRAWLLEVHADRGHIVLNGRIVSRRVRVGMRAPDRRAGVPLHAPIGSTCGKTRKCLARRNVAPDRRSMRPCMRLSDWSRLSFGHEQQTRNENSQRGCDLPDRR